VKDTTELMLEKLCLHAQLVKEARLVLEFDATDETIIVKMGPDTAFKSYPGQGIQSSLFDAFAWVNRLVGRQEAKAPT
jgi:hypothetical protein